MAIRSSPRRSGCARNRSGTRPCGSRAAASNAASAAFSLAAGATLLEAADTDAGILSHVTRTDTYDHVWLLRMGPSYNPSEQSDRIYIKMDGHDIYKYAVKTVPVVVKQNLEKSVALDPKSTGKRAATTPTTQPAATRKTAPTPYPTAASSPSCSSTRQWAA